MKKMGVFSARDLRNRSGGLLNQAKRGGLSLITKHGRPAVLAVPFDSRLLEIGLHRHLAASLYAQKLLTLAESAKLADLPIEQFLNVLAASGGDAVDYPAEEISTDLAPPNR